MACKKLTHCSSILDYYEFVQVSRDDQSILTFNRHEQPVLACSIHPTKDWAMTSGENNKTYIWNTSTKVFLYELRGHLRAVTCCAFSADGNFIASGDKVGKILLFKIVSEKIWIYWDYSMGPMSWIKWHPWKNVLIGGAKNGAIYIWTIASNDVNVLTSPYCKCNTGEVTYDGKKLVAGYANGLVRLWDLKTFTCINEFVSSHPLGHVKSVGAICCAPDRQFYLAGSEGEWIL